MFRKSLTLISILSFIVNLVILPKIAYGNDFLNYTIPVPSVQADLIGEDNDTFSVRVSWSLPEDLEADAYGFVVEKEGPNGRKAAAIYYPSSQGFYDTTDSGYYHDEAVASGDTYTYYVKAYDRSGKESDYGQATTIIPDSTLPPLAIQNVQVTPQGDQSLIVQYDITQSAYNYLTFNGAKYGDGATAGTHNSITIPATGLVPETEYSYSIKAYLNKDNESGAATYEAKYYWNPCGLGMITSDLHAVYLKVPPTYEMTFNGQTYTSTTKPPSSSPDYGSYVAINNLTPATLYDYTVKTCGGVRQAATNVHVDLSQTSATSSSATLEPYGTYSNMPSNGEVTYHQLCPATPADPQCDIETHTIPWANPLTIGGLKPSRDYEVTITAKLGKYSFTAGAANAKAKSSINFGGAKFNNGYPYYEPTSCEYNSKKIYWTNYYTYVYTYDFGDVLNYTGEIRIGNYTYISPVYGYVFSGTLDDLISPYKFYSSTSLGNFSNLYKTAYVKMIQKSDPFDFNSANIIGSTMACTLNPNIIVSTPGSAPASSSTTTPSSTVPSASTSTAPSASTPVVGNAVTNAGPANLATYYLPDEIKQDDAQGAVSYLTELPVKTEVEYGFQSNDYPKRMSVANPADGETTFHIAKIPNLKARTYRYRVVSTDAQGKNYYSEERTLKYGNKYKRYFGDMWEWTRFTLSKKTLNEGLSNSKYFLGNTWNRTASTFR